ncbi:beta-glucuronidase [Paenibacillus phyllosphaerae]|uniref:Beta-glucuronidase n=1 Tax=Paenibacillus phyllosphaerae TaxID=274593 RepID=A0A7W5AUA5_9BACL|nr:glycoside hydrolase family 2 TIM barrel-domain containing protein [Paenibacillus phyllosphaerae]MBB3108920.1 beta-glucuronidase [Paenibacillus phyllosphaerae]
MLQTTLSLRLIDGHDVPFQNGIPVPSFEPQERTVIPLAGNWRSRRFQADHEFSMSERGAAWLKRLQECEGEFIAASADTGWAEHGLPLPENRLTGEETAHAAETYEDGVWYQRTFVVDGLAAGKSYTLKSLGINYVADIWLNGQWIGYHEGGFTPFAFHVTSFLREGVNDIRIRVDNPPWGSRDDIIPAVAGTDFFNYTGVIQDLYVEVTSAVHVVRVDVVPITTCGRLKVRAVIENRGLVPQTVDIAGSIYEANAGGADFLTSPLAASIKGKLAVIDHPMTDRLKLSAGEVRVLGYEIKVLNPKLWSVWQPHLYVASFTAASATTVQPDEPHDQFCTQFGIRTLGTDQTHILLNGVPVFLAGIARHEEWPDTGRTADWHRIRADLLQMKALNANMVRTGHYPNHIYTYLLLDRLGMLAMSEIPLWQFETAHYEAQERKGLADQMWREMVFSQYNRPSVILWSTQNESKDVVLRLAYNRRLVRDLRERYNDGRLITQSSAADQPGPADPSMEPLDVAAWTMYFGIFHGSTYYEGTRAFLEEARMAFPDKPILNTEFGHWTGQDNGEEAKQLDTYRDTRRALMEHAALHADGTFNPKGYLAGIDFWVMYNWYVNHNQWIDTFGLYHMNRTKAKQLATIIAEDYGRMTRPNGGLAAVVASARAEGTTL